MSDQSTTVVGDQFFVSPAHVTEFNVTSFIFGVLFPSARRRDYGNIQLMSERNTIR